MEQEVFMNCSKSTSLWILKLNEDNEIYLLIGNVNYFPLFVLLDTYQIGGSCCC